MLRMDVVVPVCATNAPHGSTGSNRRSTATQHWAKEDIAAVGGCCSKLCGSKPAAPWWAKSILAGENSILMTRDAWCEGTVTPGNIHGDKRRAERRAKRLARLTQIGQKVEVLVAEKRDWYVGKVVGNDLGGGTRSTEFLVVEFSNGSVLFNVRPNELRPVPRATFLHWVLAVVTFITYAVGLSLNLLPSVHSYRVGPRGEVWLFPDRAFTHMPNKTLYNLTYAEVAAAAASPETWLAAILNDNVKEYRGRTMFGAGRNDTVCWFRDSQNELLGYRARITGSFGLMLAFLSCADLRKLPITFQILNVLLYPLNGAFGKVFDSLATQWSWKHSGDTRQQVLRRTVPNAAIHFMLFFVVMALMLWFAIPSYYSAMQRMGTSRWISRSGALVLLVALGYWAVMYMRLLHFNVLLRDVMDTDENLGRLASSMMYLETTKQYLDPTLCNMFPCACIVLYAVTGPNVPWVYRVVLALNIMIVLPLLVWNYVLVQPLPFLEPVSWELVHKYLPQDQLTQDWFSIGVYLAVFSIFFMGVIGRHVTDPITTARRVTNLNVHVRKAMTSWASKSWQVGASRRRRTSLYSVSNTLATESGPKARTRNLVKKWASVVRSRTMGGVRSIVSADDYQALNRRAPSREVIRPIADYFETYLARPGVRLHQSTQLPRCLQSLLIPTQVRRVLAVMATTIASYMAHVVAETPPDQHGALCETLTAVLEDMACSKQDDHDFVLDLAGRRQYKKSSIAKLRNVVRRLGTKHRDHIYLKCMHGVGRETGFQQFVITADQVQDLAAAGLRLRDQSLRQIVVTEGMPWAMGVVRLLDSACGVRDRYDAFLSMLAVKSGGDFHSAPLKGLFRVSEKLWLRPTTNPEPQKAFFPRGDCSNMFDVVRGMIVCANMDVMNICLGLLAACDLDLWRAMLMEGFVTGDEDVTAAQVSGILEELHVLRVKNRFRRPTSSGWADVMIKYVGRRGK